MLGLAHTAWPPAAVRATQGSVGERVTLTWMIFRDAQLDDEESKERAEEEIRHWQAHHRPRSLPHDCAGTFSRSVQRCVLGEFCFIYF